MSSVPKSKPSLKSIITEKIRTDGFLSIADYMEIALADAQQGYYHIRDPLGKAGDFTTAPEISQVFGELIGAWLLTLWDMTGRPSKNQLIELGPGRGTLMNDILRTAKLLPDFLPNINLHFVETSPALREKQKQAISGYHIAPRWHNSLDDVDTGATLLVANEFLDALPIEHYIKKGGLWFQRGVGVDEQGALHFTLSDQCCTLPALLPHHPEKFQDGDILEYRPAHQLFIDQLSKRAKQKPLAALLIDYGYNSSQPGDTFQAMKSHKYTDPLKEPGHADLTAHVDFEDLKIRALKAGLKVYGGMTQGQFLMSLGLAERTEQLLKAADKKEAQNITTGAQRLVDPNQMGQLFKVMVITSPDFPVPPPFEIFKNSQKE